MPQKNFSQKVSNNTPNHNQLTNPLTIGGFLVGLIAGALALYLFVALPLQLENSNLNERIGYAEQFIVQDTESTTLRGTVDAVAENSLTLKVQDVAVLFYGGQETRTVQVSENTEIVLQQEKDPDVYNAEFEAYEQQTANLDPDDLENFPTPPDFFTEQVISLSDIELGMEITVEAAQNVNTQKEFEAVKIMVSDVNSLDPGSVDPNSI